MERRAVITGLAGLVAAGGLFGRRRGAAWPDGAVICHAAAAEPAAPAPAAGGLVYEGSQILALGAMRQIANHYPGGFTVRGGGCDNAVQAVDSGAAHLGGMCCPPVGGRAKDLRAWAVARDIKAVVAHPRLALDGVTSAQLRAIASGRVLHWREVGGGEGTVALVLRRHCPDYPEPVRRFLLPGGGTLSPRALVVEDEQPLVETVARFPGAIGVASWVYARPLVASGKLKLLTLDGVRMTPQAAANGSYPLVAPLFLIFREWRPEMAGLFDYLYGPEGRALIADRLLPVSAEEAGYRAG